MANLDIAFPEKTRQEKTRIAKQFYKNLIDTFIETIKLFSLSQKSVQKRAVIDLTEIKDLIAKGKNIQMHSGHQMNWEFGHLAVAYNMPLPWISVYMSINNKALDRIFLKLRNKGNAVLVSAKSFKGHAHLAFKQQYAIGLIADQNPGVIGKGFWLNFFGKPVPFTSGPDKAARKYDAAVVFVSFVKVKRGHYQFNPVVIAENGAELTEGELTIKYRDFLEETIRAHPDNYLWTHRRWKWDYNSGYEKRWIDVTPPPAFFTNN